jgi:hypothetical protein
MDGYGGNALGDSSEKRYDAGDVGGIGGLGHIAQDDVVHLDGVDAVSREQFGNGDAPQLTRMYGG